MKKLLLSFISLLSIIFLSLCTSSVAHGRAIVRPRDERYAVNHTGWIDAFGQPRSFADIEKRQLDVHDGMEEWVDSFGQISYFKPEQLQSLTIRTNDEQVVVSNLPNITIRRAEDRGYISHTSKNYYLPRRPPIQWTELKREVVISRDCGRGVRMGDRRFFIFCDSEVQLLPIPSRPQDNPSLVSFSANSLAYDYSDGADRNRAVVLTETGMYDDVGRLAAWVNLFQNESDFNRDEERRRREGANSKSRIAVWVESGPAVLSNHRAVQFAPVVKITATDGRGYTYDYMGNTLLNITYNPDRRLAPTVERLGHTFYRPGEVNFGSFSSAYFGGRYLYVLGPSGKDARNGGGILFGRVPVNQYHDKRQYRYWNGRSWDAAIPNRLTHAESAVVIPGSFSRADIIFSRLHGTFLLIYMNGRVDSTFYYKKLLAPQVIQPPFPSVPFDSPEWDAYVENIFRHPWSTEEEVLLKTTPHLQREYNYAGSIATGYFGEQDISNGGNKLLLSWTSRSGQRAWILPTGEYHHGIGYIEFARTSGSSSVGNNSD